MTRYDKLVGKVADIVIGSRPDDILKRMIFYFLSRLVMIKTSVYQKICISTRFDLLESRELAEIIKETLIKASAHIASSYFQADCTKRPQGAGLRGRPLAAGEKHRPRRQPRLYCRISRSLK